MSAPNTDNELSEPLRRRLRDAVRTIEAPPDLAVKIRQGMEKTSQPWWIQPVWATAALFVILFGGGLQTVRVRQDVRAQNTQLLRVGLADHVECALRLFHAAQPATPTAETLKQLGPEFKTLAPMISTRLPQYRLVDGHLCQAKGRAYVHLVLEKDGHLMSLVITRRSSGEAFARSILVPTARTAGIPIEDARLERLSVSGFESGRFFVFVVSDFDAVSNTKIAVSIAPSVVGILG